MCGYFIQAPVVSSDARSTRSCGFFILFVVVNIDVGLLSLLLEDLSKLIFADAAEERSHVVRFLDHPLERATTAQINTGQSISSSHSG